MPGKMVPGRCRFCPDAHAATALDRFKKDYFDVIIIDEAHHCLSDSYQRVLAYFDQAKVLGVTATPDRGDMRNLGSLLSKSCI